MNDMQELRDLIEAQDAQLKELEENSRKSAIERAKGALGKGLDDIIRKTAPKGIRSLKKIQALQEAAREAVAAADEAYSKGENSEKLDYAVEYLRAKGYDTENAHNENDWIRANIEAEVFKLKIKKAEEAAKSGETRSPSARAENSEEFREKYLKKRYNSGNAGKAQVINFLYDCYQVDDKKIVLKQLYPDIRPIKDKVDNYDDMNQYNSYYYLLEWQRPAFDSAVMMRNALRSVISQFADTVKTIIAGEAIRREIKDKDPSQFLILMLSTITIEAYTPQSHGYGIKAIRENIEHGLRELNAYNSFVELIAKVIEIPEYTTLQVHMRGIYRLIDMLNEALDCLRTDIATYRAEEISPETSAGEVLRDITLWTPEYLRATMDLFRPVEKEVPPVSDEARQVARARIRRDLKSQISWDRIYTSYKKAYTGGKE